MAADTLSILITSSAKFVYIKKTKADNFTSGQFFLIGGLRKQKWHHSLYKRLN